MDFVFDISQDELPIFLAETEDHLQILDEGLIRLEHQEIDSDLIQQIFRSAHTLKGTAGMIGHQRLVELTHALEMAFDGIRKNELVVNSHLVDICLDAVDALRLLRDEVIHGKMSQVDVQALVGRINGFILREKEDAQNFHARTDDLSKLKPAAPIEAEQPIQDEIVAELWCIRAVISPTSIASAARAFQLMLALQDMGEIFSMDPSSEQIDTASPVAIFSAKIKTDLTIEQIEQALSDVPEIDQLEVNQNGKHASPDPLQPVTIGISAAKSDDEEISEETDSDGNPETTYPDEIAPLLGEYLVTKGYITSDQLQTALETQQNRSNKKKLLGQILVKIGVLKQATLQAAIADLLQQQRKTIQNLQQSVSEPPRARSSEKTVRTSVERLDSLMNLVGELITDRNRLFKIRGDLKSRQRGQEEINVLMETVTHIGRITDQLQDEVMRIRMLPVSNVFNKFPRMVRDLAQKVNKDIALVIQGQDTELDRSVIEEINDPLIHLLRNAVDHGIELPEERIAKGKPAQGTIRLTARHEQARIIITVEDDGRGLNIDRLKQSAVQKGFISEIEAGQMSVDKAVDLIFISGLSTAKQLTDISGRGVGMDIVRSNIEKINGSMMVDTTLNVGTCFQIILPLTLAIVPTLLVRVGPSTFAIPLIMVTETERITSDDTYTINGQPVILLRNHVLPIVKLSEVYGIPASDTAQKYSYIVVVSSNKTRIGLVVDTLVGEEEVVVKSLSKVLGDITGISSAAILGDGQVSLIVDVPGLFKLAGVH